MSRLNCKAGFSRPWLAHRSDHNDGSPHHDAHEIGNTDGNTSRIEYSDTAFRVLSSAPTCQHIGHLQVIHAPNIRNRNVKTSQRSQAHNLRQSNGRSEPTLSPNSLFAWWSCLKTNAYRSTSMKASTFKTDTTETPKRSQSTCGISN
eukprot:1156673-Amphidinium_carterae.2